MAICKKIRRTSKRVCIGALNRKIILEVRTITPPVGGSVDFTETFTEPTTVWANVVTKTGTEIFDETNTVQNISHEIYIRYTPNITPEKWAKLSSIDSGIDDYLDIINVENINEENRFYKLSCSFRGPINKPVNYAGI